MMETEEIDEAIKARIKQLLPKMIIQVRDHNNLTDEQKADNKIAWRVIEVGRFESVLGIHLDDPDLATQLESNVGFAMIGLVDVMFDVVAPMVQPGDLLQRLPGLRDEVDQYAGREIFDEEYEEFVAELGYERRPKKPLAAEA